VGTFADLHKRWEDAKKKAPDPKLAKKTFTKGLGPVLSDLDTAVSDLSAARHKAKYNPEKILLLSPKVVSLCTKAKAIASEYGSFAQKQKWGPVASAASAIETTLLTHATTEAKEWRPTKEYIDLWKRVTLEMALSAAGLEDAKTADDLRKILEKKTKDINAARGSDKAIKDEIDRITSTWPKGDVEYRGDDIAKEVAYALKNPDSAKDAAKSVQRQMTALLARKKDLEARLKELKDYLKKPEVQASNWKSHGQQTVLQGDDSLRQYNAALAKGAVEMVKLPKAT
jgi:hypothetical protein